MAPQSAYLWLALASLVSVVACGEAKPAAAPIAPAAADASVAVSPAQDAAPAAAALPPGVPDTPAGNQLAWVLAGIAKPPSEADVTAHLTPDFLAQFPVATTVGIFNHLASDLTPITVNRVAAGLTPTQIGAIVRSDKSAPAAGAAVEVTLEVEPAEPHRIKILYFAKVIDAKVATSWDEVQAGLRAVAPLVSFLAAEITGGKCVPISGIEPKKPLAIGSAFKLYVLEALAKQIAAGKHKWDDPIAIDDAKKSLPSGDMRNEPAGKTFSVREFAERMIKVSDNTATDHVLAFVGRTAVEDAVKSAGHATPTLLAPFLSTREMSALKLLGSPDELHTYATADIPKKRKILETFAQRDLKSIPPESMGWAKPRMIDSIEWFASAEDLCRLAIALKARADTPVTAPVGEILSKNPGLGDEAGAYKYIGFKGGSEPGVLNLTWLLQRKSDDKWLFMTVGFNDTTSEIDEGKAISATTTARAFLGK